MVEQVRVNPEEVRGYGNVCEEHSLDDFIVSSSGLAKEKENVHGALTDVYKLVYSLYGLIFDFDTGNKQLYLQMEVADTLSFGFDTANKQLYLVDEDDTGFSLGFDEDTNELYITDDAPPIVHNYTLALDSESYTTTGSLSVSATLLDDGVAVSGATISFTGGTSTVTATTDSSGVATATVNFTSSGTLTATYSNVSDTATVTVQTYIFYDEGSASGVSNYSTAHILETGGTTTFTLTWDTTENAYHIETTPSKASMIGIDALDGYTGDFKLSADIMRTSTSYVGGLCYCQKEKYGFFYGLGSSKFIGHHYANGSWRGELNPTGSSSLNTWYHMELVKEGTTITISVYDSTGVTLLASTSKTYTDDDNYYGFPMSNFYFKNVKAEYI